ISDANETFASVPGGWTLSPDGRAISIPATSFNGAITIDAAGGDDALTVDLAGGDAVPAGNVTFHGGSGLSDMLLLTGGNQGTVSYSYANAHVGSVAMSN